MDRLQSMRVFESVVDEGGFAAAARALDMSAPVVTRLVADLEEHLGTRLLQRSTRRLSLTEAGQQYLSRIRHILQDIDEADAMASSHTTEMAGVLRIQAPPLLNVSGTSIEWGYLNSGVHDSQRDHEFDRATVRVVVESIAALDDALDVLQS